MSIIVEDGTVVADANSFVSIADARTIALSYGLELTGVDDDAKLALVMAGRWLKQKEKTLQGCRLSGSQTLPYPRTPVEVYGDLKESSFIPQELIDSQVVAAVEQSIVGGILASSQSATASSVKKEKLEGVGETEYFEGGTADSTSANIKLAISLLTPLTKSALASSGGGYDVQRG
jgi:hypothetical protein|tara:strand:- start:925 stop:1452 length:528 start_codon:yes stop_codon:yes gene_type:complete